MYSSFPYSWLPKNKTRGKSKSNLQKFRRKFWVSFSFHGKFVIEDIETQVTGTYQANIAVNL